MTLRPLPPLLQEKSKREINEDPDRIASDLSAIREWIEKQPHLKSVNPSDQWLLAFLRGNKFSLEKTKNKLDIYYTLRTVVPEIFRNRNPFDPTIQAILNMGIFLPLRVSKSEDSCRVCLQRYKDFDSSKYRFVDVLKVCFMIIEILILEDDNFIIAGEDLLVDGTGLDLTTLSQWTPALAKKCVTIFMKALPVRLKSSHLFNMSPGYETAYNLFKIFLSEKLKNRFHIYGNGFEALYDVMPRNLLPKEYGGEQGTVQELTDYWKKKVESYSEWYLREELACSDESLRPNNPHTSSTLFGVEGSFRKLQVD
ncbi:alpha-tocopherol transfer protein-like isoform X1 [Vanessa atalanta]|uniref:alpha-tocopherol transfer protein-like isoform X1 n=1 Tax=Vanessa atalanta TaxID=42275 RepID=UPI001FCD94F2|nr:alpha-tocopherol transfer protein-like isoform X1 [Vanessa atalanta]